MKIEVLLSIMNLNKKNLDKMNIKSKCTVINQCGKEDYSEYENFNIYSYDEIGLSNSRNRGLEKVSEDIILLCDDDVVYNKDYESLIIDEFKKYPKADIIIFNITSPNRKIRRINKNMRLHKYNRRGYSSQRIAFRRESIINNKLVFNQLFGSGALYSSGEDTLFITDALNNHLKVYLSCKYIGTVNHSKSSWFNGYNEKYFFDKGALYTAINERFRKLLFLQYLIRHKEVLKDIKFFEAYKIMKKGSEDYLERIYRR